MNLDEAIKILKQNGFITEAYDAVTDHQYIKQGKQPFASYSFKLEKNLERALAEEGYKVKSNNIYIKIFNSIGERFDIVVAQEYPDGRNIKSDDKVNINVVGSESNKVSSYSYHENQVSLLILKRDGSAKDVSAEKEFDVRNIPVMVDWIISNIDGEL